MRVESHRFSSEFEVDAASVIHFPRGLIGFAQETAFILVEREQSPRIAWLQSVTTPELAIPVVSGHELDYPGYPDVRVDRALYACDGQMLDEDTALVVVLTCLPGVAPTVNLMAPLMVNARTRKGAQVLLHGTRFSARALLALTPGEETTAETSPSETGPRAEVAVSWP